MQADRQAAPALPAQGWVRWHVSRGPEAADAEVQIVKPQCQNRAHQLFGCGCGKLALERRLDYILDQRERMRRLDYEVSPLIVEAG